MKKFLLVASFIASIAVEKAVIANQTKTIYIPLEVVYLPKPTQSIQPTQSAQSTQPKEQTEPSVPVKTASIEAYDWKFDTWTWEQLADFLTYY